LLPLLIEAEIASEEEARIGTLAVRCRVEVL
jgi:hypothetical protein